MKRIIYSYGLPYKILNFCLQEVALILIIKNLTFISMASHPSKEV